MKERPILFSARMVKAILADKKTQTRRVLKQKEITTAGIRGIMGGTGPAFGPCPYGQPGDRLWVRETWRKAEYQESTQGFERRKDPDGDFVAIRYRATSIGLFGEVWRPSIFMPRWASRITLEIVDVRAERVQEISVTDTDAEGVKLTEFFDELWDSINAKRGFPWKSNPWVWVVEFRRVQ